MKLLLMLFSATGTVLSTVTKTAPTSTATIVKIVETGLTSTTYVPVDTATTFERTAIYTDLHTTGYTTTTYTIGTNIYTTTRTVRSTSVRSHTTTQ